VVFSVKGGKPDLLFAPANPNTLIVQKPTNEEIAFSVSFGQFFGSKGTLCQNHWAKKAASGSGNMWRTGTLAHECLPIMFMLWNQGLTKAIVRTASIRNPVS